MDRESPIRQELLSAAECAGTEVRFIRSDTALELDGSGQSACLPLLGGGDQRGGLSVLVSQGEFGHADHRRYGGWMWSGPLLARMDLPGWRCWRWAITAPGIPQGGSYWSRSARRSPLISVGRHNGYGHPDPGTVEACWRPGRGVPDRPAWDGHRPAEQSLI